MNWKKTAAAAMGALCLLRILPQMPLAAALEGSCGEGLTWRYDAGNSTLTISGAGSMEDYAEGAERPWEAFAADVTALRLEEGLLSVGAEAFLGFGSLREVTLPETCGKVGEKAFFACSSLEQISIHHPFCKIADQSSTFPVTPISGYAYSSAEAYAETYGREFTAFEPPVLMGDADLDGRITNADAQLVLHSYSTASTGNEALLKGRALAAADIDHDLRITASDASNILGLVRAQDEAAARVVQYEIHGDTVTITGLKENVRELIIPSEIEGCPVTAIGDNAFANTLSLTSVSLPDGLERIGDYAFYKCVMLRQVLAPEELREIGYMAFAETPWLEQKQKSGEFAAVGGILIDGKACTGDVIIPEGIREISLYAFSDNAAMTSVTLPESVSEIAYAAFMNCAALRDVTILNPECGIDNNPFTFCNATVDGSFVFDGTLHAPEGSVAQGYARLYDRSFALLRAALLGDVSGDGTVNASDAAILLSAAALEGSTGTNPLSAEQKAVADVNGDETYNASDAAFILMYAAAAGSGFQGTMEEFLQR